MPPTAGMLGRCARALRRAFAPPSLDLPLGIPDAPGLLQADSPPTMLWQDFPMVVRHGIPLVPR
jgi:hypothetical protein